MKWIFRIFGGLLTLLVVAIAVASVWFWFKPVGVNNYINRETIKLAIDSPELLTQLGIIDNTPLDFHSGKLADYTREQNLKSIEKLKKARAGLDQYGPDGLEGQELLSWRITAWFFDDLIRQTEFEYSGYPINQISGVTVNIPSFLTDAHVIKNEKSAKRYISRLEEYGRVLGEMRVQVESSRDNGVIAPDFVIEKALTGMRTFIEGGPDANLLVTTLPEKLDKIGLDEATKDDYVTQAKTAVASHVIPGFEAMIALHEELLTQTNHDAGIWRIPNGEKIYEIALKANTTTELTADEIHNIGLSEVDRIEREMYDILVGEGLITPPQIVAGPEGLVERLGLGEPTLVGDGACASDGDGRVAAPDVLDDIADAIVAAADESVVDRELATPDADGTLAVEALCPDVVTTEPAELPLPDGAVSSAVQALMANPEYHFPNTDEGRKEMIDYLLEFNDKVMAIAGDYFITLPPQPLEVVRVPEFSQDSAPGGYYTPPAIDGSRPGRFYINQKDTADNPRWTLPTLMIHEAAPGHHFQLSASQLIKNVPFIRTVSPFSAYSEGWALYAERIAKEDMNLYADDPLSDLGRLQAEMFRAVRLVVDTGMHAKRWSREQAIEYMISKTGMTDAEVTREIERYVVWPGQATAYKTGQLAILRMRETAEAELGNKFDLREFHEAILLNGAMPLGILEDSVDDWIAAEKAK